MSAYEGVRIADFSQGVAGPMAAMLLGDLGAEVVKIEPPGGDVLKDHPGYLAFNRNKQVVTLALDDAGARELIAGADIAIFDHAPGRLEAPIRTWSTPGCRPMAWPGPGASSRRATTCSPP